MTLYEKILRELFQDFSFFAVDASNNEKVYLSFDEVNDPKGLSGPLNLFVAQYMVALNLSDNLVTSMDEMGVKITKDPKTLSGVSIEMGNGTIPNSLRTVMFTHALFSQLGSEYENESPVAGSEINITGLFIQGRDLINIYFAQLSEILSATAEQKQAIVDLAEQGNQQAQEVVDNIKQDVSEEESKQDKTKEPSKKSDNLDPVSQILPSSDTLEVESPVADEKPKKTLKSDPGA